MSYADYQLESDYFRYDYTNRTMNYKGNVGINHESRMINANEFVYNFQNKTGDARKLRINIEGALAGAQSAHISPTHSVLEDVYFTTCTLPHNHHYKVSAKKVFFYPETGDIIAQNNRVYFYGVPIFAFPSYIYNGNGTIKPVGGESSSGGNGINVAPELGSNAVDGTFARWNWGYVFSPKSTGSFTLSSTSIRGFRGGFRHRLVPHKDHRIYFKAFGVHDTGFEGGATYEYDFLKMEGKQEDQNLFTKAFRPFLETESPRGTFSFGYLQNEFIRLNLVSFSPRTAIKMTHIPFLFESQLEMNLSSSIIEEAEVKSGRNELDLKAERQWQFKRNSMGAFARYIGRDYNRYNGWERKLVGVSYSQKIAHLRPTITYTKPLVNEGGSPFDFDSRNEIQNDDLGFRLKIPGYGRWPSLGIEANFDLIKQEMRDLIYTFGIPMHCWTLEIKWNSVWQTVEIGVGLIRLPSSNSKNK